MTFEDIQKQLKKKNTLRSLFAKKRSLFTKKLLTGKSLFRGNYFLSKLSAFLICRLLKGSLTVILEL